MKILVCAVIILLTIRNFYLFLNTAKNNIASQIHPLFRLHKTITWFITISVPMLVIEIYNTPSYDDLYSFKINVGIFYIIINLVTLYIFKIAKEKNKSYDYKEDRYFVNNKGAQVAIKDFIFIGFITIMCILIFLWIKNVAIPVIIFILSFGGIFKKIWL